MKLFLFFTGKSLTMATFINLLCILFPVSMFLSLLSNGSDLLERHWADRHGVHRPGGRPAVSLPAQYHHCALHSFAGYCVLHHFRAHLLQLAACFSAQRWGTPLPVSMTRSHFFCLNHFGTVIRNEYITWICFGCIFYRSYLEVDIGLSGEQAEHYMQRAIFLCFAALDTLKRLIFVACLFDSLKVRFRNRKHLFKKER